MLKLGNFTDCCFSTKFSFFDKRDNPGYRNSLNTHQHVISIIYTHYITLYQVQVLYFLLSFVAHYHLLTSSKTF